MSGQTPARPPGEARIPRSSELTLKGLDQMNVSTHDEAEWHAATDRYAGALQKLRNGDRGARPALLAAYRELQALALLCPSEPANKPFRD